MTSKNQKLVIFFCITFTFIVSQVAYQHLYRVEPWVSGDWLINYAGGFVRRGLPGQLILTISQYFAWPPIIALVIFKAIFYLLFGIGLFLIGKTKGVFALEFLMLLSPWALMFPLLDPVGGGRKEICYFALLVLSLSLGNSSLLRIWRLTSIGHVVLLSLILVTMLSMHEGLVFFLHFFCARNFILNGFRRHNLQLRTYLPYFIALIFDVCIFAFFKGNQIISAQICSRLIQEGFDESICGGAIRALQSFDFSVHAGYFWNYLPAAFLSFTGLVFYAYLTFADYHLWNILRVLGLLILPTAPLYFLGADWGRWIHITALSCFLVMWSVREKVHVDRLRFKSRTEKIFFAILAGIYVFSWRIIHFPGYFNREEDFVSSSISTWIERVWQPYDYIVTLLK